jgi:DNA polymerase
MWIDTLSMARVVHGARGGNSLAKLAERHGIGRKGDEVIAAFGKRYADFDQYYLRKYGEYCCNDCDLEYSLALILSKHFPDPDELHLIDRTVRMFTEPVLWLHTGKLRKYIDYLKEHQTELLVRAGVQLSDLTSNAKFADALNFLNVEPPTKISKTTGQVTFAFAKTDEGMQELAEHPDDAVQALVAARLNAKSTINETRAIRMISMASRGPACVYINHAGAGQTMRASGGDKMNWQNFQRGGMLRESVEAPDGHVLVVGDSANIESRLDDWVSGQEDQIEAYERYDRGEGPDIYCVMGEKIFGRAISKKDDPDERFLGKTAKLGLGFGMGHLKFMQAVRSQTKGKTVLSEDEALNIVNIYRSSHSQVVKFWRRCDEALGAISRGEEGVKVDYRGLVTTCEDGLLLPNGLVIKYPDLQHSRDAGWTYFDGKARQKIYGGKVCENIVQALARIVVMYQTLKVPHRLVLVVHDEGVWCVPTKESKMCVAVVEQALRTPLHWCTDLPLNCEVGVHKSYGKAKQ